MEIDIMDKLKNAVCGVRIDKMEDGNLIVCLMADEGDLLIKLGYFNPSQNVAKWEFYAGDSYATRM